jgi:hypothetical protein
MSSPGLVLFRGGVTLSILLWWGTQPHASLAHGLSKGATLGRAPANCPATPTPRRFHPQVFGLGVGSGPVWAVMGGQSAVIPTEPHSTTSPGQARYGWGMKILWAMAPGTTDAVTLRSWNLATGARVLLSSTLGSAVRCLSHPPAQAMQPMAGAMDS